MPGTTVTLQPVSTRWRMIFHFMPKSRATTCGRRDAACSDLPLGCVLIGPAAGRITNSGFKPGSQVNAFSRHDFASQVAADQPRTCRALATRLASSRSSVDRMPFIAPWTRVSRTRARVSIPSIPMMPCLARKSSSDPLRAEVTHPAAELADHESADPGAAAFGILLVDPVVADLRVGHRHDLAVIGRVGQDLLVAGHARVEDDLAIDLAPAPNAQPVNTVPSSSASFAVSIVTYGAAGPPLPNLGA